jgi:two-component system OmpR family sensor kinase
VSERVNSLRRQLLLGVLLPLVAIGLVSAGVVYLQARREGAELLDYQLEQIAAFLSDQTLAAHAIPGFVPTAPDSDDSILVRITDRDGQELYLSGDVPRLPQTGGQGFATLAAADGERWRQFTLFTVDRVIQVMQREEEQTERGADGALGVLAPILLLIPVLAAMIWWVIRRALRPLHELAGAMAERDVDDLDELALDRAPAEVLPLMGEVNSLLARLDAAMRSQRQFIADAAHSLRTPLAAILLQLQVLDSAPNAAERGRRQEQLKAGIARTAKLVNQLLTLARAENRSEAEPTAVDLERVLKLVVAEHASLAAARDIDLALVESAESPVLGDEAELTTLLANLLDNAIRHTPEHGAVDVSLAGRGGGVVLVEISDTGPGIPEAQLPHVFDRFFRVPGTAAEGSGLGLAIARRIAERHGATLELRNLAPASGLVASLRFRAA